MQQKLYIFGAGASHPYVGSKTRKQLPLAANFFKIFNELAISEDSDVTIGHIINFVRDIRGISVDHLNDWNENVESLLTDIEAGISTYTSGLDKNYEKAVLYISAYTQLIFLFSTILNEIQNGDICSNYKRIVDSCNPGDYFITFNWDTLLDRALFSSERWHPNDGYEIKFKGIYENQWNSPKHYTSSSELKLLKLHGSTNWLIPLFTY